jgi:hypothetical protein
VRGGDQLPVAVSGRDGDPEDRRALVIGEAANGDGLRMSSALGPDVLVANKVVAAIAAK